MGTGVVVVAMVALALSIRCALATEYVVGQGSFPQPARFLRCTYDSWAQDQEFVVGDTLVFNFGVGESSVVLVDKQDYEECGPGLGTSTSPIDISYRAPLLITLSKTGTIYFVSIVGSNCYQKLAITVQSAPSTDDSPSSSLPAISWSSSHQPSMSNASAVKAVVGFLVTYALVMAMVLLQDLVQKYLGIGFF